MITGIDHTVVVSETLADAALTAARLGFRTTPAAHHPFGTANTLVQLGDTYLEYLAILDESLFPEERPDAFSFPSFNRDFLIGEGAGLSMLALKTDDPEALAARLAEVGLSRYPTFSFRRTAQAPDGAELPVSFTLAFASHADFVRAGLFALVHHQPENFWRAAYQAHPNTAVAIASVTMVAPNPEATARTLGAVTGALPVEADGALHVRLADGSRIEVIDAATHAARTGSDAFQGKALPRHAAMTIAVADLSAARASLSAGGLPFEARGEALVIAPEHGGGTGYRFVPA